MTFNIANGTGADVFSVLDRATDEVIDVINYMLLKAKRQPKSEAGAAAPRKKRGDDIWNYI